MPKKLKLALVAVFVGGLFIWAMPIFKRARTEAWMNSCISNIRQIDGAKDQWRIEHHKTTNDIPTWPDVMQYLGRGTSGEIPKCHSGGTYTLNRLDQAPKCSYPEHSTLP